MDLGVTLREFSDWLKEHGGSASGYTPPAVAVTRVSSQIPWDVCSVSFQECCDAPLMAAIFNVDGRRELRMYETSCASRVSCLSSSCYTSYLMTILTLIRFHQTHPFAILPPPPLPPGSVSSVLFHPTHADVRSTPFTFCWIILMYSHKSDASRYPYRLCVPWPSVCCFSLFTRSLAGVAARPGGGCMDHSICPPWHPHQQFF